VLRGRIKGYAFFVSLVFEGVFEDEEPLEVFTGSDGVCEASPTLFLLIVEIAY